MKVEEHGVAVACPLYGCVSGHCHHARGRCRVCPVMRFCFRFCEALSSFSTLWATFSIVVLGTSGTLYSFLIWPEEFFL